MPVSQPFTLTWLRKYWQSAYSWGRASFLATFVLLAAACVSGTDIAALDHTEPIEFSYEERVAIPAIDDRELIYFIDRPLVSQKVPILLSIDGSSCIGQLRPTFRNSSYRPDAESPALYARVLVEKPGVDPEADYPSECTEDFLKHYSMDQRVTDHLRTLQHLSATADWWDGTLLVWGWSDGGDIAAQLTAYYPNIERAVIGAAGGGYTMAEHFEDFWVCSEERAGERRPRCVEKMREQFQKIFDNPTWTKTWSGHDNSWKVWATRLNSRLSNILRDNQTPILLVQGAEDFDSTPAASSRKLVADLEAVGNDAYTYWEIPGMKHGVGSLPAEQKALVEAAMLNWLLNVDVGEGGPPSFGAAPTLAEPED